MLLLWGNEGKPGAGREEIPVLSEVCLIAADGQVVVIYHPGSCYVGHFQGLEWPWRGIQPCWVRVDALEQRFMVALPCVAAVVLPA